MAIDPTTITPTTAQVAALIPHRTRDGDGQQPGQFTDRTTPTAAHVATEIVRAARLVSLSLGSPYTEWDGNLLDAAKDVVAARVALEIERAYYGDGSSPDDAPLDQLGRRYAEDLAALQATARNNQLGGNRIHSIRQIPAARAQPVLINGLLPEQILNGPDPDA